ncbi:UDP-N-acetylmuramoyl-L-alanine--D-glutamate ligase [Pontixanthobacter sp.]|uniref:UDP-N-acetylmuramoyl-L-alanine--D-glutamate ligase n=1 Tax=Pontixanthobacter sp. TaxID=2792078 RepID=UPI003C7D794E
MITSAAFHGKRYAILGLARSGLAAAQALLASGARITAWDRQDIARAALTDAVSEGRAELADPLALDLTGYDGVVVSPGVPLNTHPIAAHAARYGVPVIGDIELFALARSSLPPHRIVGVTGTNGKSTTTALIQHMCKEAGLPSLMGGNIGLPIMAQPALEPNQNGDAVYVLELSSYQIDLTYNLDCDIGILLNISPDHLDRYDSFDAYAAAKARLFSMMGPGSPAIISGADQKSLDIMQALGAAGRADDVVDLSHLPDADQRRWPALQGPHNLQNALVAASAGHALGISDADLHRALESFAGLPHRMEIVAEHAGVTFINDSKATNQASSAPALAAYPPSPDKRVHWIVGGLAKEDGLGECARYLGNVAAAYTIGESGPRFAELLEGTVTVHKAELLCEAVVRAVRNAKTGDVVLLSPACASFDQFRDYEKRGEHFRQIVSALTHDRPPAGAAHEQ